MSGNASIAAAHRRRASAAKTTNSKFAEYNDPNNAKNRVNDNASDNKKTTLNLPDVLALLSRQIAELRKYRDDNNEHWKEHDEFLGVICPKIDEVVDFIEKHNNLERRVEMLETELRRIRVNNESENNENNENNSKTE